MEAIYAQHMLWQQQFLNVSEWPVTVPVNAWQPSKELSWQFKSLIYQYLSKIEARRNSLSFNYLTENILCILKSQIKVEL